jgi:hypothetical protein
MGLRSSDNGVFTQCAGKPGIEPASFVEVNVEFYATTDGKLLGAIT